MDKKSIKLLFIGSGAFASALANCFLTQKGNNVKILFYCVGEAEFNDILKQQNTKYFPNEKFGRKIDMVSLDLKKCLIQKPDYIVLACPSKFIADNVTKIQKMLINNPIFINIAKGFSSEGTL
jgi:glycerol-3-phosphate dehydrogenase (NAD(P)+)